MCEQLRKTLMAATEDLVLFVGIQASGKSTFYAERFSGTHVRINLDMLKTRYREQLLMTACLQGRTSFVVDNTNLTRIDRARYILPARAAGFRVIGFYFQSKVSVCLERNAQREGRQRVPDLAILGSTKRLEFPSVVEGFDSLSFVRIGADREFVVEEWKSDS